MLLCGAWRNVRTRALTPADASMQLRRRACPVGKILFAEKRSVDVSSARLRVDMSIACELNGAVVQTYATMQRKKADLAKQMAQTVFDISMDAQEGALYSVLDDMSDQYIKEQMLAYFLLLKHKHPATEVCSLRCLSAIGSSCATLACQHAWRARTMATSQMATRAGRAR